MRLQQAGVWIGRAVASAMMLAGCGVASAQDYPTKPIRVMVGFPAGTTTDNVARMLGKVMQAQLGQTIIVEPKVGAAGLIAGLALKTATPDGYTLFFGGVAGFTPVFTKDNPIDASKEFEPISDSMAAPYLLVVSTKLGINSFEELVAFSKSKPSGTLVHAVSIANQALAMHAIAAAKGLSYRDINVRTMPETMPLMATGEVALFLNVAANLGAGLQSNTFRPILATAYKRLPTFPNVPTSGELGIPGIEQSGFVGGFWAPKGTPAAIVRRLSTAAQAAVKDPEVVQQFGRLQYEAVGSTPEGQLKSFNETMAFWTRVAKAANYQPPQ